jgi:predicted DNA-binding protein (MmcQ/YjbR family)
MTNESIRAHCLGLPHVTEIVQWEGHLLFKVGGKMFAIIELDGHSCALRCDPERYAELVEMPDIVPASHNMWKYQWVTLEQLGALPDRELRELLTASYHIVKATLPKRVQAELDGVAAKPSKAGLRTRRSRRAT